MIPESLRPIRPSPYLRSLLDEVDALVQRVSPSAADPRREALLDEAALASLRLDGSRLASVPSNADRGAGGAPTSGVRARSGTWLDALARFTPNEVDDAIAAIEFDGVRRVLDADDLGPLLLTEPAAALRQVHRRLTAGLVEPTEAGRLRESEQAVHDASIGRIVYRATPPLEIDARIDRLTRWLATAAASEHPVIASGIAHHDLLEVHPFESANGRLARAVARLLLRAGGLDPGGFAACEEALARDALGYYEEVIATVRRTDLVPWLERWTEAIAAGLRASAARLDLPPEPPPERAAAFVGHRDDADFTVADYRDEVGVGLDEAMADLRPLLDAGAVDRVPGTRGLRLRIRPYSDGASVGPPG